jgi:hypothetical protein
VPEHEPPRGTHRSMVDPQDGPNFMTRTRGPDHA